MKAIFSHVGGFKKLLVLILTVFLSFMVISFIALLIAMPFTETPLFTGSGSFSFSVGMLRYLQMMQTISIFIVPALMAGLLFHGHLTRGIGFIRPGSSLLLISFLVIVSAQPLVSYLGVWNSGMQLPEMLKGMEQWMEQSEKNANNLILRLLDTDRPAILFLNLIMIAILPALGEEMFFRGALQPVLGEWWKNNHAAVWITAILFSAIHMQFFTFLPRFLLGLILGYLMLWGKNLWYPIMGHFANNFLSLIIFYYYRHAHPEINPLDPESEQMPVFWILPVTILMIFLLFRFFIISRNAYKKNKMSVKYL